MNNPLLTEDLGVYIIDMTPKVEEQVVFNEDGSYSIFINARLNQERQMLAYQHALMHIIKNDFEKYDADVNTSAQGDGWKSRLLHEIISSSSLRENGYKNNAPCQDALEMI